MEIQTYVSYFLTLWKETCLNRLPWLKSERKGTANSLESSRRIRLLIPSGPVVFPVLRALRTDSISTGLKCREYIFILTLYVGQVEVGQH